MDLPGEQHRVEDRARVVAGDVTQVGHLAGVGVDLDDGDMGAEGVGRARSLEGGGLDDAVVTGRGGDRRPVGAHRGGSGDVEGPVVGVEDDVDLVGLEE